MKASWDQNVQRELNMYLQNDFSVRVAPLRSKVWIESPVVLFGAFAQFHLGQVKIDQPQDLISYI